jgi:alkanesulfonate monooxygenase SsuD/methylene tetrahydromethanopterin reductase-like flavin-dependent oxidoreductase (luciferase family)
MTILSLAYDMRAPEFGARPVDLYRAMLDQCAWADGLGFASVSFMEHHASTDGYLPSPLVAASAAAGRTQDILITISVMLLPLYHPLRAAEDLAVLDLVSEGRLRLVVGAGYREEEYAQFGLELRKRPSLMERGIETLKKAWTGEPFEFEGESVRILPRPAQTPRPEIWLGGSSKAAARRAARMADGYMPVSPNLFADYVSACAELGTTPCEPEPRASYMFIHVAPDPNAAWREIAPHALHETNDYGRWLRGLGNAVYSETDDADALRASGQYRIVTPEECVELARKEGVLSLKPLMGGLDPELAWRSLKLIETDVLPHL